MSKNYLKLFIVLCSIHFATTFSFGQNTVSGNLTDEAGSPLFGAYVLVKGSTEDVTTTDLDGNFTLETSKEYPFDLEISYTGFSSQTISVSKSGSIGSIMLKESVLMLNETVITASRRKEKELVAPASVSVLNQRKIITTPQTDATRILLDVPGVQIQQQSASRSNIEMRGGSSVFDTRVLPLKDYRALSAPGVNTYDGGLSGSTIDIEKIEVVRGAGSALYGPGVSTGVVHFITKNPIDHPGTALELFAGELNTLGGSIRHAGKSKNSKFGYKVNATRRQGNEWTLDGSEGTYDVLGNFTSQLDKFRRQVIKPGIINNHVDLNSEGTVLLTEEDLDPDGDGNMMRADYESTLADLTFEFRPQDDLSITLHGGIYNGQGVFYNDQGEGLAQSTEFWTQARVQKGGFFGQVYYVNNNGGTDNQPTFLYQTGNSTPSARTQLEGQLQYNFDVPSFFNSNFTTGIDYRDTGLDSGNLVYGRFEDDSDYRIIGSYIQGKFELNPKLDIVLAGRYDVFSFLNDGAFSPRAALVYKPNSKSSFRASYNKASVPPTALNMFIDFPVRVVAPGIMDFWLLNQSEPQTFSVNPVIDVSIPGVPDIPYGTPGLPLSIPYGAVAAPVIEGVIESFAGNPELASLVPLLEQFFGGYIPGGVTGQLIGVNAFDGSEITELISTESAKIPTTTTFEIGYSGLIKDKFKVNVDLYNIHNRGSSDFTQIGPLISLINSDVSGDLNKTVTDDLSAYLQSVGVDVANAEAIAAQVGAGFAEGGAGFDTEASALYGAFGAVETEQVPQDDLVHVSAGYRIFDSSYNYWGADIGVEYYINQDFSVFGNYSWVNDDIFDVKQSDDSDVTFQTYLGAPANKFRLGASYLPQSGGIRGQISFQHDDEFNSNFGDFRGVADKKNLVDASIGYQFKNGIALDVSGTNIFNNKFRALPNMPAIGRRVLGKVMFSF